MVQVNHQADPDMQSSFTPLPAGEYQVVMVANKENAKQTGIVCEFDVASGQYQGRKLWCNLSLFHENEKAKEIGYRLVNDMALACGVAGIGDLDEILGRTMVAIVKIRKDDATQNDVSGFKAVGNAPPAAQPRTATTNNASAAPAAKKMPWQK